MNYYTSNKKLERTFRLVFSETSSLHFTIRSLETCQQINLTLVCRVKFP